MQFVLVFHLMDGLVATTHVVRVTEVSVIELPLHVEQITRELQHATPALRPILVQAQPIVPSRG